MARNLEFTDKMDDSKVVMLLNRHIGPDPNNPDAPYIDGGKFAEELYFWAAQEKSVLVKINSVGGNVIHGYTIVDVVIHAKADTHNIGLAASMAGIIFLFGATRAAEEYSTLMLHGPHGGNSDVYLDMIRSQFKGMLEKRTKLPTEFIDKIMDDGDHFFDASDMKDYGLADTINPTKLKWTKPTTNSLTELYNVYNSLEKQQTMEKPDWLKKFFGGDTELDSVTNAMKLKTDYDAVKASLSVLKSEKDQADARIILLESQLEAVKNADVKARAATLVETAIADKKLTLTAEQKESMISLAVENYDSVKLMFESMKSVRASATSIPDESGKTKGMTYEQLASKNPALLQEIAQNDPELFAKLQDDYISSKK